MSFRKKNIVVGQPRDVGASSSSIKSSLIPGIRPSPLDGRLTTSTGTKSLDSLLAGHAGLALGTSLLIEETGTTDFGGWLLRYYAAEGVVQGHYVHVLGMPEAWGRELPGEGTVEKGSGEKSVKVDSEKMKIAWRYERLGEFGAGSNRERASPQSSASPSALAPAIFCHEFDLSKRLTLPSPSNMKFVPVQRNLDFEERDTSKSPFQPFLSHLTAQLSETPQNSIHRVIVPNLLSPALYPPSTSNPRHVLQFLHSLRALLRNHPTQLTVMLTLPLSLHQRSTGLTRWIELLSDGVFELAPFPPTALPTKSIPGAQTQQEEPPQGMMKIHRLPIFHEKGGGGGEACGIGDDLAFTLSRRRGLVVKPFSLPPVEGDSEAQEAAGHGIEHEGGKAMKKDIEF